MNMTAALRDAYDPFIRAIANACAITFQGNASNQLQQDAFFFLDHWYEEDLGAIYVKSVLNAIQMSKNYHQLVSAIPID